jgi:hypothetical protein
MMVEVLFKVLFVSSIAYGPIILLLLMWNNETPTLLTNKGKKIKQVSTINDEKIL